MNEKISVIVRFHDITKIANLSKALFSLENQTYSNVEPIIMLQSFSEESKEQVIKELHKFTWNNSVDPKVINVFNDDYNDLRSVLLNEAFNSTKDAKYLAILDYDDYLRSKHYELLIGRLQKTEAAIAFSNHMTIEYTPHECYDQTTKIEYIRRYDVLRNNFLRSNHFCICDFVVDRSRIDEGVLSIPNDMTYEEDYHLFLKIFLRAPMDITLGRLKNPQVIRRISDDGSNTIITDFDSKEKRLEKQKHKDYGQRLNFLIKKELKQEHDLTFTCLWINPLQIREGKVYEWVAKHWAHLVQILPAMGDFQDLKVFYPPQYRDTFKDQPLKYKFVEMNKQICDEFKAYANGASWNEEGINNWLDMLKGNDSDITKLEAKLLDDSWKKYPFDNLVTWSTSGSVENYCKENNITHISLELGPTRQPFFLSGFCDPFGVNGNSMIHYLPEFTSFIERCEDLEQKGEQLLSMVHTKEACAPEFLEDLKQNNDKIALIPLQLEDDTNFLLYCDKYKSILDFVKHVTTYLTSNGWTCIVKNHPGYKSSSYLKAKYEECLDWIAEQNNDNIILFDEDLPHREYLGLLKNVDAVVSINSSMACEASLLGTPYVLEGISSFAQESYITLEEINTLSKEEVKARQKIQYKSSIFSLLYLFVPLGDIFISTSLFKRILEAKQYKKSYDNGGSEGLLEQVLKKQRTEYFDYLAAGRKVIGLPSVANNLATMPMSTKGDLTLPRILKTIISKKYRRKFKKLG